jgi:hypothetical protein
MVLNYFRRNKMNVTDYLKQVANIEQSTIPEDTSKIYISKFDGSYITRVGMEENIKFLADREITEELTHGVGFSPKDNKWYGWSHRAIYGFTIGSTCKKGDCHYIGSTEQKQKEDAIRFWSGDNHVNVRCDGIKIDGDDRFFIIKWDYPDSVPNKNLRGTTSSIAHYITPLGKGEWVAKTMEDAKQMAIDFKNGVS